MNELNFVCGKDIKKGWDNCDFQLAEGVDYCDMNVYPYPFEDNTYDYILFKQGFGYAIEQMKCIKELWRISKPNGIIEIEETWYNNKGVTTNFYGQHRGASDVQFYSLEGTPFDISEKKYFKVMSMEIIPTPIGKWMPLSWALKLDCFISGLISQIKVKLKVLK